MKNIITIILVLLVSSSGFACDLEDACINEIQKASKKISEKNYTGAIKDYSKAIKEMPDCIEAYKYRGDAKSKLELHEAAIKDYTKATELDQKWGEPYYGRGVAKYYIGDIKGALMDLQKSEKLGVKKATNIIAKIRK